LKPFQDAALEVIEDNWQSNTRQFVESQQRQIQSLRQGLEALSKRVEALEGKKAGKGGDE